MEEELNIAEASNQELLRECIDAHFNFSLYDIEYLEELEEELTKRLTLIGFLEK